MNDLISRQAAIDDVEKKIRYTDHDEPVIDWNDFVVALCFLPSAQPDFSCEGCQTPKHICGICMRNYPNITDHYTVGEAG